MHSVFSVKKYLCFLEKKQGIGLQNNGNGVRFVAAASNLLMARAYIFTKIKNAILVLY